MGKASWPLGDPGWSAGCRSASYDYVKKKWMTMTRKYRMLQIFCASVEPLETNMVLPPIPGGSKGTTWFEMELAKRSDKIRKTQPFDSMAESPTLDSLVQCQPSTDSFSKSSNSQAHLFRAWRHPHSSPFSVRGLLWQWWLSYPLRTSIKLYAMTMHRNS